MGGEEWCVIKCFRDINFVGSSFFRFVFISVEVVDFFGRFCLSLFGVFLGFLLGGGGLFGVVGRVVLGMELG